MIPTIAQTIIWLALERQQIPSKRCQNINSQIHAIKLEVSQLLMDYMKEQKNAR